MLENLTPQERLERITSIINKGIYLLALKEGWFCPVKKKEDKVEMSIEKKQIADFCKNNGRITNKDIQDLLGVHRNTATAKLKEMVLKGLLVKSGNRRHTYYVFNVHRGKNVHRNEGENCA